jgi:D-glycero-alpha-D-manno-heptose 1-phosphate guanylyltransferase
MMERSVPDGWHGASALSLENDLLPQLIADGRRIFGMPVAGRFLDIGLPADYDKAASLVAALGLNKKGKE